MIYVAMSTFDENEILISVQLLEAYPIYYEDGTFDALVSFNGNTILLSELQAEGTDDCYVLTLTLGGIALGKLLTALLAGAAVVAGGALVYQTVSIAVKSGWFTYQTKSLTEEKVRTRTKTAEKQRGRDNPDVYFLAELYQNKLCINASPCTQKTAAEKVRKFGDSFWTPMAMHDIQLAYRIDKGPSSEFFDLHQQTNGSNTGTTTGMYKHFHPKNHIYNGRSVHLWYGEPIKGVY